MEFRIKRAKITDWRDVQNLNRQLFLHDFPFDKALDRGWPHSIKGKKYFQEAIKKKDRICLIAVANKKTVGYLIGVIWKKWFSRPVKTAELENMYVLKDYRRSGIGSALVKKFVEWCKKKGVKSVLVMAYLRNKTALPFYQKNFFRSLSERLERKL